MMLPLERESVEPVAAHLEPRRVRASHQSLHHFVAKSEWSDVAILARARAHMVAAMDRVERRYRNVDDTGFRRHGRGSVGVARQHCGRWACKKLPGGGERVVGDGIGKRADRMADLPAGGWELGRTRRAKAGVPEPVGFATKPQIALQQLREAEATDVLQGLTFRLFPAPELSDRQRSGRSF